MKNNKFNFIISDFIKDDQIELDYQKKVIDHISYKKLQNSDFINPSIKMSRISYSILFVIFVLFIFIVRLFYLQIYKGDYYRSVAEGNRIRIETIKAPRGIIYDRHHQPLVKNIPNFTLSIIRGDLPSNENERNNIINQVSSMINIPSVDINNKLADANLWDETEIADNLSYNIGVNLIISMPSMPGVKCEVQAIREYNNAVALSHLVGYIGKINEQEYLENKQNDYLINDYIGKSGLELYYEKLLKGQNGKKQIEIDSTQKEIETIASQEPISGDDLILTIDNELQTKTYEVLEKYAASVNSTGAAAVVMDPRNGEVLALVSWPGFDANEFIKGINYDDYQKLLNDPNKPLYNKAIAGEYPSGSTFKIVIASAALQENVINANTTVNSVGGIVIHGYKYPDWKTGGHGITNVTKALAESVNTFFYIAGGGTYNEETNTIDGGLGIDRIDTYAAKFGLGQKTNIDLPGEKTGFIPSRDWKKEVKNEDWYIGDTYHVSIGQGDVLATPIQVANYTAVIANDGILYQPHLLKQISNSDKNTTQDIASKVINSNFIDQSNIAIVQKGMREAVLSGSARILQSLPVNAAAKTGTVQHSGEGENHSWLTVYAPYESPELVMTVIVEKGNAGTGVALPVVQEVLKWYFNH